MGNAKKFEDLEVWKKARELAKRIYSVTNSDKFRHEFTLINQMKRSSGSIMDNIAEGFDRDGSKEFKQFLSIAKGSVAELKSQLYRCFDQDNLNQNTFSELYCHCDEVSKMLSGLIKFLKDTGYKGLKYK